LAVLCTLTSLFSLPALAPLPGAAAEPPATVARTVRISIDSLARSTGPSPLRFAGGALRALTPATTPPLTACAPIWFTMVAFAWHQGAGDDVSSTVWSDAGARAEVLQDQDADPDPGTPEWHPGLRTSPLYWTRGTRCVRFQLRLPAGAVISDLRADFVNTSGTAEGPHVSSAASWTRQFLGATAADASTEQPEMVTRAAWGARPPRKHCLGYSPSIRMAYVHHTSGSNDYTAAQSDDIVRGIQYYHEHTRGYCDIAYSFLVDRFGTIYVGRYDSDNTSVNVDPGSQAGFNDGTFSVSAMGNYQTAVPSLATVDAIQRVLAWRLDAAHLPPAGTDTMTSTGGSTTRYHRGQTVKLPLISGHRQTGITDCPGDHLWTQLDAIRSAVYQLGRPKFFRPAQSDPQVTPFRDVDRFTAKGTDAMQWQIDIADESGNVIQSLSGQGVVLSVNWDGTDRDGLPARPGTYTATIWGSTADGLTATPATLPVAVNPIPVTPGPTPTPTPT
jgi:hypothetical protein